LKLARLAICAVALGNIVLKKTSAAQLTPGSYVLLTVLSPTRSGGAAGARKLTCCRLILALQACLAIQLLGLILVAAC
jgi:hypothetical protein